MNASPTTTSIALSDSVAPGSQDGLPTPVDLMPTAFVNGAETFQHYQVLRREDGSLWELGRGAMGVTYKAFDTNLRCYVALKVISAQHLHSEVSCQRFLREARVAAKLRHRNIATVYHLGVDPQSFFYSMEFVDGQTLENLVQRTGPLPLDSVLRIGLQTSRALAAASLQGLIHRDIKPANIMVLHQDDEGENEIFVKVIDFGLARSYEPGASNAQVTSTGFVGSPLYSSPEQLEEQTLDVRSDIYSLGVTLWILLAGEPPFNGTMTQVITGHLQADPPWWQLADCPAPARALLERMLRKDPAERFQTAAEVRHAIEECLLAVGGAGGRAVAVSRSAAGVKLPSPASRTRLSSVVSDLGTQLMSLTTSTLSRSRVPARQAGARLGKNTLPWVIAGSAAATICVLSVIFFHGSKSEAVTTRAPAPAHVAGQAPAPAAVSTPAPAPPAAIPSQIVASPVATIPEATPPPMPAPSPLAEIISAPPESTPASTSVEPPVAAQPSASPAAVSEESSDATETNTPGGEARKPASATSHSHVHHTAKKAPTPAPNFLQKLFGIKPKPSPKPSPSQR